MFKSCGKCLYWDPQKPEPKLCKVCNNYRNMFALTNRRTRPAGNDLALLLKGS